MAFVILACTDIRAQKVNIEFPFAAPPESIEELRRVMEKTFRGEEEAIKRTNGFTDTRPCEPFTISRVQRYSDDTQSWEDIASPQALETYDQLYVFRKNTAKADIATERALPAPRRSPFFPYALAGGPKGSSGPPASPDGTASYARGGSCSQSQAPPPQSQHHHQQLQTYPTASASTSPYRFPPASQSNSSPYAGAPGAALSRGSPGRQSSTHAIPLLPPPGAVSAVTADGSVLMYRERTTPERVEYLFRFADQNRQGALAPRDYEVMFRAADIRFPSAVVYDLHQHFSHPSGHDGERRMSMEDFQHYASDFPVAVNIAYQRITNQEREEAIVGAQRTAAQRVDDLQRQVKDLEERLAAAQRELHKQADQKTRLQDSLQELYRQRDPEYCRDEQQLLDKEVSVFKYRERLSREEQDYERMAMERRRRTAHQATVDSSPIPTGGASSYDDGRYGPA